MRQIKFYETRLDCRVIEKSLRRNGLSEEVTFEEIFESDLDLSEKLSLIGHEG